jgi:hypothetical protein
VRLVRGGFACLVALALSSAPAEAASRAPSWTPARHAALPPGAKGLAQGYLPSLSCPSVGNCAATGVYLDASGSTQGLVLEEARGRWSSATIAPPVGAAQSATVTPFSVSCAAPGDCSAVGYFVDQAGAGQALAVNERGGRWQRAQEVALPPGAAGAGQSAVLRSVSCAGALACSAVGTYLGAAAPVGYAEGMVANEVAGVWQRAQPVTLPANAGANPSVSLAQLSCAAPGDCSAIGSYLDNDNVTHSMLVDEVGGAWRPAAMLTPPPNANRYELAQLNSLDCAGPGRCTALGTYETAAGLAEGFTVTEAGNRWRRAQEIVMPVGPATNPHVFFYGFNDISCPGATSCSAGGQYRDGQGRYQGFFVDEVHGTWRAARALSLPPSSLMAGKNGGVVAVSCTAVGACSAGAAYLDAANRYQGLVASEVDGRWRQGVKIALPAGAQGVGVDGGVYSLVCHTPRVCTAAGSYLSSPSTYQAFIVTSG